ncbi:MAG: plastocyanin/azurin family copper-binding protein, partial [Gammaproteobacteria bacterium]|nr:plastocyanin/azurin family copper-binding protein [Gammaproteobacteria bacterium]
TAYLVAISPTLQETLKQRRSLELDAAQSQTAMRLAMQMVDDGQFIKTTPYEPQTAKGLFESRCAQCHDLAQVEQRPPRTNEEVSALVTRMVQNGLAADERELAQIIWYLRANYVGDAASPVTTRRRPEQDAETIVIRSVGDELRFDQTEIAAQAGSTITVVLENTSTQMPHNVTILHSAADVDVVTAAALGAASRDYVPEHPAIVASTGTADPGARVQVTFTAPAAGEYPFLCLIPGHSLLMRGTLRVWDAAGR